MSCLGIGECMIRSVPAMQDQGWGDQGLGRGGGGGLGQCQGVPVNSSAVQSLLVVPCARDLGPRSHRLKSIRMGRSHHLGLELGPI